MTETKKLNKYVFYFTYAVVVEAEEDDEQAEDLAHEEFTKQLRDGLESGDFAMSDAELCDWWD